MSPRRLYKRSAVALQHGEGAGGDQGAVMTIFSKASTSGMSF